MTTNPSRRTIIFGDVHACPDELQDLLREVRAGEDDELISVGDLVGKGPDSRAVLEWAMAAKNLKVVLGNHELRLLLAWRRGEVPERASARRAYLQLGAEFERYMRWVAFWPLLIEREDFLVVHAGFDPRRGPAERRPADELTNIRHLPDTGRPWYEEYRGDKLVVFGHWSAQGLVLRDNAVGLDTGCVYGGRLSALVLPERRVVSVPARKAYCVREPESARELLWTR